MWNPWKHLRIAGALCIIVAACVHNIMLTFIGLLIQYCGVVGAIDLLERKFDLFIEDKQKPEDK